MATLRDIKRRISSVQSTQQITKAMKMVAAAKLRKAQMQIIEARPYAKRLSKMLGHVATKVDRNLHPLMMEREPNRVCYVAVSADKGLCGSFNAGIIRRVQDEIRSCPANEKFIIPIGRKVREHFLKRDYNVYTHYEDFFHELSFSFAQAIGQDIINAYKENTFDQINVVYNEFKSAAHHRIIVEQLLPIVPVLPQDEKYPVDYFFEPSPGDILDEICPRNINFQIWRILLESNAAEHAARMIAMENATENAQDMIKELTLYYNKVRQATITRELIEVVSGADALKG